MVFVKAVLTRGSGQTGLIEINAWGLGLCCLQQAAERAMKYLIQFSQQHESFWLPELDSLLELNGLSPGAAYDHDAAWAIVSKGHKVRLLLHCHKTSNNERQTVPANVQISCHPSKYAYTSTPEYS